MSTQSFLSVDQLLQPWQFTALNSAQTLVLAAVAGAALLSAALLLHRRYRAAADTESFNGASPQLAEQYRQQMAQALAEGVQLSHEDQALVLGAGKVTAEPIHYGNEVVAAVEPEVEEGGKPKLELVGGIDLNRPRPSADELMQGIRQKTRDYVPPVVAASDYIVEEMGDNGGYENYAVSRS